MKCLLAEREGLTGYLRFPAEHHHRTRHSNVPRMSAPPDITMNRARPFTPDSGATTGASGVSAAGQDLGW